MVDDFQPRALVVASFQSAILWQGYRQNVTYNICQPVALSLTFHSAVHVHQMPTRAVAMTAAPSFSSHLDSILVKAMVYLHNFLLNLTGVQV